MRRWVTTLAIAFGLGLAIATPAVAQVKAIGLLAGATFAKLGGADGGSGSDNENKVGLAVGGFVDIGLGGIVSIRPEAAYVQKGAKATDGDFESKLKLNYIEVPVLLVVSVPTGGGAVRPEFFAGPAVAFKAGCNLSGSGGGTSASVSCEEADLPVKSTDFGLMFGAGVAVRNFMASIRYDMGLSKIDDSDDPADVKNRAFMILLGWAFPMMGN